MPHRLYISNDPADEVLAIELDRHLAPLTMQGLICSWSERCITAGAARPREIDTHLDQATIILLLVSASFLASDECLNLSRRALECHGADQATIIPVILSPCLWKLAPFGHLQPLPDRGRPVTSWPSNNEAWLNVVSGLLDIVRRPLPRSPVQGNGVGPCGTTVPRGEVAPTAEGLPWHMWILPGLAFGVFFGLAIGALTRDPAAGLRAGGLSGVLFGALSAVFVRLIVRSPGLNRASGAAALPEGELLLHDGPANRFKGLEAVGGKLFLTTRRLWFRSHGFNVQVHEVSYPLEELRSAEAVRTLGLIPTGLRVTRASGQTERFVVLGNQKWARHISEALAAVRGPVRGPSVLAK